MATRRIYYDDSFEREFTATVLSCEPTLHGTAPAWEVVLDSTAFYPSSGGQPHDVGRLGEANVLDVREELEEVVHVVDRHL
jgi:alanyl-tRNA synthetase